MFGNFILSVLAVGLLLLFSCGENDSSNPAAVLVETRVVYRTNQVPVAKVTNTYNKTNQVYQTNKAASRKFAFSLVRPMFMYHADATNRSQIDGTAAFTNTQWLAEFRETNTYVLYGRDNSAYEFETIPKITFAGPSFLEFYIDIPLAQRVAITNFVVKNRLASTFSISSASQGGFYSPLYLVKKYPDGPQKEFFLGIYNVCREQIPAGKVINLVRLDVKTLRCTYTFVDKE